MPLTEPDVVFARVLLAALLPVVVAGPIRWAVPAWLIMTNLDATGSGTASYAQVGWLNAVKAVGLPAWLWYRLRHAPGRLDRSVGARAWLLLAGYAALASLWSPYPLAGVKLAAGMAAILLALAVLERAARAGSLDSRAVLVFLGGTLLLGILQTALFADGSFGFAGRNMPQRLTSFVAAQQYAALLAAFAAWSLWSPALGPRVRSALLLTLFAALAVNGSRTWSLSALAAIGVHAVASRQRLAGLLRLGVAVAVLASVPAVRRSLAPKAVPEPANRLTATASALLTGQDRADGMGLGTMRFRLTMYRGVLAEMRSSPRWRWLFGHGTAAGGRLALRLFPWSYRPESLDANRVVHNEWLRAAYEWGAVGLALWLIVLAGVAGLAWRNRADPHGGALLSYLPALVLGLSAENVVDGAGNAVTAGFLLLAALALAHAPSRQERSEPG